MFIELTNKFLIVLFFLSLLNVLRHSFYFMQTYLTSTDEEPKKYILKKEQLIIFGLSFSYVLTLLITGFKL